jgi:hypothetical protein
LRPHWNEAARCGADGENTYMQDIVFILVTIGFFAVAMAYVRGCDRLK